MDEQQNAEVADVQPEFSGSVSIQCVGIDGLLHACLPHDDYALCGTKILRKKLGKTDSARHSCYGCTY